MSKPVVIDYKDNNDVKKAWKLAKKHIISMKRYSYTDNLLFIPGCLFLAKVLFDKNSSIGSYAGLFSLFAVSAGCFLKANKERQYIKKIFVGKDKNSMGIYFSYIDAYNSLNEIKEKVDSKARSFTILASSLLSAGYVCYKCTFSSNVSILTASAVVLFGVGLSFSSYLDAKRKGKEIVELEGEVKDSFLKRPIVDVLPPDRKFEI